MIVILSILLTAQSVVIVWLWFRVNSLSKTQVFTSQIILHAALKSAIDAEMYEEAAKIKKIIEGL